MGPFRDPWSARVERADGLKAQIEAARGELHELDRELASLRESWARACRWSAAPTAGGRFRMGMLVGALVAGLSPFVLLSLLAGAGVAASVIDVLAR